MSQTPKKILMLAQFYPPIIGGVERHVRDLSASLVAEGHQVMVATLWQAGWGDELPARDFENGVEIRRIPATMNRLAGVLFQDAKRSYAPPFPDPETTLALRDLIRDFQPDIIHAHNWIVFSALPLKKWSGAKLVVTLHEHGLSCPRWTLIYKDQPCSGPALGKCLDCLIDHYGAPKGVVTVFGQRVMSAIERRTVDLFVPVSQAVADTSALPGSPYPYEVIPNFISGVIPELDDLDSYLSQLPPDGFLMFVGAFGRHKGVDILLDAYEQMETDVPLVMIGYEIPEFEMPETLPDNVHIFRHWPNAAVLKAWEHSGIAIVPSNWPEPCPTVAMEAMLAGRPVVGTRMGGIIDLVEEDHNGFLVPPGDATALATALTRLSNDPDRQQRMGQASAEKVRGFLAADVVPRLEAAYSRLLNGAS